MGGIIAAFIALVIGIVLITMAKKAWWALTGSSTPLESRDNGKDDPARGQFTPQDFNELSPSNFGLAAGAACPLHGGPYLGYTQFTRYKPAAIGAGSKDYLCVIGCRECFDEAKANREFSWTRKSYSTHPVWASAQIYPYLLGDTNFDIRRTFVAFDEPAALSLAQDWIASTDPATRADGIEALRFRKSDANIDRVRRLLLDKESWRRHKSVDGAAFHMLHAWGFEYGEVHKMRDALSAKPE